MQFQPSLALCLLCCMLLCACVTPRKLPALWQPWCKSSRIKVLSCESQPCFCVCVCMCASHPEHELDNFQPALPLIFSSAHEAAQQQHNKSEHRFIETPVLPLFNLRNPRGFKPTNTPKENLVLQYAMISCAGMVFQGSDSTPTPCTRRVSFCGVDLPWSTRTDGDMVWRYGSCLKFVGLSDVLTLIDGSSCRRWEDKQTTNYGGP